mgnify:CR=1 FL=1
MTSQIITLNRLGVAVASDSISTITDGNGDFVANVQNSQKVFDLGDDHKIVVVNSDSTSISGAPIYTLLSAWSSGLKEPLPTTWAYMEKFLDWLQEQPLETFPDSADEFRTFIFDQLRPISDAVAEQFGGWRPFAENTLQSIATIPEFAKLYRGALGRKINAFLRNLESTKVHVFVDQELPPEIQVEMQKQACLTFGAEAMVDLWFPDEAVPKATKLRLKKNIHKVLNRIPVEKETSQSRLAFVGYGSDEIYPKLWEVGISSKFGQLVRWRGLGKAELEEGKRSEIYLKAQTSAIQNFLDGVHPNFLTDLEHSLPLAVVEDRQADFEDPSELTDDEKDIWLGIGGSISGKLQKYIEQFKAQNKSGIVNRLDFMGPSELAQMARSLLSLEILATMNDRGPSTVGGDIVIATIDYRNGVNWISPK